MSMPKMTAEAIARFNRLNSRGVSAVALEEGGRRLVVLFGGSISGDSFTSDDSEALAAILREQHGVAYAAWDFSSSVRPDEGTVVKYARLDFLGDLKRVIESVRPEVQERIREFEAVGSRMDPDEIFSELCFCILTANYTAEGGIRIQRLMGDQFKISPVDEVAACLRSAGHRFPNKRAEFICAARQLDGELLRTLQMDDQSARDWLVKHVKGIGCKEASHFLRNIGRKDLAIIDRHILRFLSRMGLIEVVPTSVTPKRYVSYERLLRAISSELGITLAELDLYLWYFMTGKVLK
ncbi:MAG: N-glycosylase/DNA lyase [Candidatus Methanosuratincola sp.]